MKKLNKLKNILIGFVIVLMLALTAYFNNNVNATTSFISGNIDDFWLGNRYTSVIKHRNGRMYASGGAAATEVGQLGVGNADASSTYQELVFHTHFYGRGDSVKQYIPFGNTDYRSAFILTEKGEVWYTSNNTTANVFQASVFGESSINDKFSNSVDSGKITTTTLAGSSVADTKKEWVRHEVLSDYSANISKIVKIQSGVQNITFVDSDNRLLGIGNSNVATNGLNMFGVETTYGTSAYPNKVVVIAENVEDTVMSYPDATVYTTLWWKTGGEWYATGSNYYNKSFASSTASNYILTSEFNSTIQVNGKKMIGKKLDMNLINSRYGTAYTHASIKQIIGLTYSTVILMHDGSAYIMGGASTYTIQNEGGTSPTAVTYVPIRLSLKASTAYQNSLGSDWNKIDELYPGANGLFVRMKTGRIMAFGPNNDGDLGFSSGNADRYLLTDITDPKNTGQMVATDGNSGSTSSEINNPIKVLSGVDTYMILRNDNALTSTSTNRNYWGGTELESGQYGFSRIKQKNKIVLPPEVLVNGTLTSTYWQVNPKIIIGPKKHETYPVFAEYQMTGCKANDGDARYDSFEPDDCKYDISAGTNKVTSNTYNSAHAANLINDTGLYPVDVTNVGLRPGNYKMVVKRYAFIGSNGTVLNPINSGARLYNDSIGDSVYYFQYRVEPRIEVGETRNIPLNSTFDPSVGVAGYNNFDESVPFGTNRYELTVLSSNVDTTTPGIYKVTYEMVDFDSDVTYTKDLLVVVNDGNYAIGKDYIIHAQDYMIRKGQVNATTVSASEIKKSAVAKVYSNVTGNLVADVTSNDITITKNTPMYIVGVDAGEYPITYKYGLETTLQITKKVVVHLGTKPTIEGIDFVSVEKGTAFNPLTGVQGRDAEDGIITTVTYDGTVDTNNCGVYVLTYKVIDSDGNETTGKRVVAVAAINELVVGNEYIIHAESFEKRKGQVDANAVTDASIIRDSSTKVYKKSDGLEVTSPSLTVTKKVPEYKVGANLGDHPITMGTTLEADLKVDIFAKIISGESPTIEGAVYTELNIGDPFNPKTGVTVRDSEDTTLNINSATVTIEGNVDIGKAGVYVVKYSATDSDTNNTSIDRVIVVKGENLVVGNGYIIMANNYQIYKSKVDANAVTTTTIKNSASVKVYNKTTGKEVSAPQITVTKNDPKYIEGALVGQYPIDFSFDTEPTLLISRKVTVISGASPVITGPGYSVIDAGDTFNPKTGMGITDAEDTTMSINSPEPTVKITNNVDPNVPGVYKVIYRAEDADGNITTKNRVVVVKGPEVFIGTNYVIIANPYTIRVAEAKTDIEFTLAKMDERSGVVVYNKNTGDLSTTATLNVDRLTFAKNVSEGVYPVEFFVDEEPALRARVDVTVTKGNPPTINASKFVEIELGNPFLPLENVSVSDDEDGVIPNTSITVTGTITPDKVGVYKLTYTVTDTDDNTTVLERVVAVSNIGELEVGNGFIIQAKPYQLRVSEVNATTVSDSDVLNRLNVVVYDKNTGNVVTGKALVLTRDDVKKFELGVGEGVYPLTVSLADEPTLTIGSKVTVVAGTPPEFVNLNIVRVDKNATFDKYAGFTVNDDYDTILPSAATIEVIGNVDTSVNDVYVLTYKVTDSDRNTTTKTRVVVVGNENEVQIGDNYIIFAKEYQIRVGQISNASISSIIIKQSAEVKVYDKNTGQYLQNQAVTYTKQTPEYSLTSTPGKYPLLFTVTADGTTKITTYVNVITGEKPVINGAVYTEINQGTAFNAYQDVTANDPEDGDITGEMDVFGTVEINTPGVYKLSYSIRDSDKNITTVNRVVVVKNPDVMTIGTQYVLMAHDYQIRVSNVNADAVSDTTVANRSEYKVYSKATGDLVTTEPANITRGNGDQEYKVGSVVGQYPITYTLSTGLTHTIKVHVIAGEPPVINGATFLEIPKGGTFNPNAGITITDEEDVNIPLSDPTYRVTGTVNTEKTGVYKVTYYVEDSDGNNDEVVRIVVVSHPDELVVGDQYIIHASDYTIRKGQVTDVLVTDDAIKIDAKAKVYAKDTGDEVANSVILTKGNPEYKVGVGLGNYPFDFTTNLEPGLTVTTKVTVVSGNSPVLTGEPFVEVPKGSTFDLLTLGRIDDVEDGVIPNGNAIITGDTVNYDVVGIYHITYTVTDTDGNTSSKPRTIAVSEPGKLVVGTNYIIQAKDYSIRKSLVDATAVSDATILNSGEVIVYNKTGVDVTSTVNRTVTKGNPEYKVGATARDYPLNYSITEEPALVISNKVTVFAGDPPTINGADFKEVPKGTGFNPLTGITVDDDYDTGLTVTIVSNNVETDKPGVYKVVYSVTDSDGNKTDKTRIVAVSAPGELVVGNGYILQANDFYKRRGQIQLGDLTMASIRRDANGRVYNKATGELVTPAGTLDKAAGYVVRAEVGTYPMTFSLGVEPTLSITINAIVSAGDAPVINNATKTALGVGTNFDPKAGITVTDDFDTLTAANVTVTGTVNKDVPGIYKLVYKVTDSDFNETTVNRVVVVTKPGVIIAGNDYIIKANDYTIRKGQVNANAVLDSTIITSAGVKVFSYETGNEITTPNITVTKNTPKYEEGVNVGDYPVTYSITEEPTLKINNKVIVEAGNIPEFKGELFVEVGKGDTEYDLFTLGDYYDREDGNLTRANVEITPNGFDVNKTGIYHVDYKLTDSDGNILEKTVVIAVSAPGELVVGTNYIIQAKNYEIYKGKVVDSATTDAAIKTSASVKVYSKAEATLGQDVTASSNITVTRIAPKYLTGVNEGNYDVKFSIEAEPALEIANVITVLKGESPKIEGANFIEVAKGSTFLPKAAVTASDLEDTGLTIADVSVVGTVNTSEVGVYKLTYLVTDSDRNETTVTRVVAVSAPNELVVGDNFIIKANGYTIRKGQVKGVELEDATIISKSRVEVYNKTTGNAVTANTTTLNLLRKTPVYVVTPDVGLYPIEFTYKAENTLKIETKINVIAGTAPTINGATFKDVPKGSIFDPLAGITVTDDFDTISPTSIIITGTVNENVVGVYPLEYKVTDSDGNTTIIKRVVAVSEPGKLVVGTNYIIQGNSYDIRKGQVNTTTVSDASILERSTVKLYDKHTGLLIGSPTFNVSKNAPVFDTDAGLGQHPVDLSPTLEPTLKLGINVNVISGTAPVIKGATFKEVLKGATFDLKTGITVTDDFDNLTIDDITIAPSTIDTTNTGVHRVTYTVRDSDGNTTTVVRVIAVSDQRELVVGKDYIISANGYEIRKGDVTATAVSNNTIITSSNVTVYNKNDGLPITNPVISVTKGTPEYKEGVQIGKYPVTFILTKDPAVKIQTFVSVINGEAPVIEIEKFTRLEVGATFDPRAGLRASDFEDTALSEADVVVENGVDTSKVGVYKVVYTVEDNDSNITTVTRIVAVGNDEQLTVGDNQIIIASDYNIRKANKDDEAIKSSVIKASAQVMLYDKTTGELLNDKIEVIISYDEPNYYTAKDVGSYHIILRSSTDNTANITINAHIIAGDPPVINNVGFVEVVAGATFDPKAGVTVTDDYDSLTATDVLVTGSVDTTIPGVYKLTYTVTDSDDNTTTVTRVVAVSKPNILVVGDTHIIRANEYTIRTGQITTNEVLDSVIKTKATVKVFEKSTGNEISNATVVLNKQTPEYAVGVPVGKYYIEYAFTSNTRAASTVKVTSHVNVIAGEPPVINISKYTEIDLDKTFDPSTGLTVSDVEDTDINKTQVVIESNVNTKVPGVYQVKYTLTDSDRNTTIVNRVVVVNDHKTVNILDNKVVVANSMVINKKDLTEEIISNESILANSNVRVYDKNTGAQLDSSQMVIKEIKPKLTVNSEVGAYYVTYVSNIDPTITITKLISIVDDNTSVKETNSIIKDKVNVITTDGSVIKANDITISASDVSGLTSQKIAALANIKAWNIENGQDMTYTIDYSRVKAVGGVYDVIITTPDGNAYTIKVTVEKVIVLPKTGYDMSLFIVMMLVSMSYISYYRISYKEE